MKHPKKKSEVVKLDFSPKSLQPKQLTTIKPIVLSDWSEFGIPNNEIISEESQAGSFWSGLTSLFSSLTVRTLDETNLTPAIEMFRSRLIDRNVAVDVADEICAMVQGNLVGVTLSSFASIEKKVYSFFTEALTRVLTPNREINLLYDIHKVKDTRPYTILFCGVNGVGKSTNLAKIAAYLLQMKMKVMIAACDTFRSGAIEQLRVHSDALQIPLFSKGYEKEPAEVAFRAIAEAKRQKIDVVLIDTAGRMQDNTLLMQALVSIVITNQPDLILFVGEALVGNDGIDQLCKFNKVIRDGTKDLRSVDGIVLSKFDTVDEKMGAAVSMTRITGKPIIFVGTGQTYSDLKRLSVHTVVASLLS